MLSILLIVDSDSFFQIYCVIDMSVRIESDLSEKTHKPAQKHPDAYDC